VYGVVTGVPSTVAFRFGGDVATPIAYSFEKYAVYDFVVPHVMPCVWPRPSDHDENVCFPKIQQEAGLGLHEMGVLITLGDGIDGDAVAADFRRKRGQVLGGGDDVELVGRLTSADHGEKYCKSLGIHKGLLNQNGCAPCAPIENWNWNRNSFAVRLSP